jgi:hypothetical protein
MLYQIYLFFWLFAVLYNTTLLIDLYAQKEFPLWDICYQWALTNILLLVLHPLLFIVYIISIIQGSDLHYLRREFLFVHKDSLRRLR